METFFKSHAYLMEHFNAPVRRSLMDTIDWSYRLIGIKGPRGVGRTSFLHPVKQSGSAVSSKI